MSTHIAEQPIYDNEQEAWQCLLDLLEGYGMPEVEGRKWVCSGNQPFPYDYHLTIVFKKARGLCEVVDDLKRAGAISYQVRDSMLDRIETALTQKRVHTAYLAPPYRVLPRIAYVKQFIEQTS